jgi:hypothetical protein
MFTIKLFVFRVASYEEQRKIARTFNPYVKFRCIYTPSRVQYPSLVILSVWFKFSGAFSKRCCKRLIALTHFPLRPSVSTSTRMAQLGSRWNSFREVLYWGWDLLISVEKIQIWLKSYKEYRHLTWRPTGINDHLDFLRYRGCCQ